jgi:hypothetical protein
MASVFMGSLTGVQKDLFIKSYSNSSQLRGSEMPYLPPRGAQGDFSFLSECFS